MLEYKVDVLYNEVRKASGIAYILLELIQKSKMESEKVATVLKKIGILIDMRVESEYERNVARAAAQSFSSLGGYVAKSANFTDIPSCVEAMRQVMASAPQAIVVSAIGKEAAQMVKALRKLGYAGIICGADGWDRNDFFSTLGSDFAPGECFYVTFFSNEYKDDEFAAFSEAFRKKFYHLIISFILIWSRCNH